MKTLLYAVFAFLLVTLIAIQGCNKSALLDSAKGQLIAAKSIVKINEPDSLIFTGAGSTDSVYWTVTSPGFDTLQTKNNKALIAFTKSGSYTIRVSAKGFAPSTVFITVTDSVYHPSKYIVPLTGDQITLVPYFYKSANSDSTYLSFVAQTKKYYCGISLLNVAHNLDSNGNYTIAFLDVTESTQCTIGDTPIASVINFSQNQPNPLPNGTFSLTVTLNGTTYTGNILATSSTITFNWNYATGVLISPKQINR